MKIKEEILETFEPNSEYPSYYHESQVLEAMELYARQSGPVWVKASGRIGELNKIIHAKDRDRICTGFFYHTNGEVFFKIYYRDDTTYSINEQDFRDRLFWQDESPKESIKEADGNQFLFELLAQHGGTIESTASLDTYNINQARASGRLYVDQNSLGYAWMPEIGKFPETVEQVEQFEKWFPLKVELPESLSSWDKVLERKKKGTKGVRSEATPIKSLTDEDALAVGKILSNNSHLSDDSIISQVKEILTTNRLYNMQTNVPPIAWYRAFQFLKSKGYEIDTPII